MIEDSVTFGLGIVLAFIFSREKEEKDSIFSGAVKSVYCVCLDFASTDILIAELKDELSNGSLADKRFAFNQFIFTC
jgi:hypothetical protein